MISWEPSQRSWGYQDCILWHTCLLKWASGLSRVPQRCRKRCRLRQPPQGAMVRNAPCGLALTIAHLAAPEKWSPPCRRA